MYWFVLQLGGSVLALAALGFGLTWWQSVRFDRKWHPRPPTVQRQDHAGDRQRPAA